MILIRLQAIIMDINFTLTFEQKQNSNEVITIPFFLWLCVVEFEQVNNFVRIKYLSIWLGFRYIQ